MKPKAVVRIFESQLTSNSQFPRRTEVRLPGLSLLLLSVSGYAQDRLPVIDMHMHATTADSQGPPPVALCVPMSFAPWDPATEYVDVFVLALKEPACADPIWSPESDRELLSETLKVMDRRNVLGVLSGSPERVAEWMDAAPERFFPGINFRLGANTISPGSLRNLHKEGRLAVFAEITNQYVGVSPDDERMDPYWNLAEELDIPVGIQLGAGPPGAIYLGAAEYRARLSSALSLEEVLADHPRLRVYIMHAGYPLLDDLLAVLYAHPQVYVGIGLIVHTQPRPAFYGFLKGITDAGFGKRVMFGSDQIVWPTTIELGIRVIEEAPFLDEKQKRDILYNNAARFLRLSDKDIARHHGM